MNVSFNGLFANCYNFIRDEFSHLSPLQKKVTIAAIAFFSCSTTAYCIYRFYYFQAHRIFGEQNEGESKQIQKVAQRTISEKSQEQAASKRIDGSQKSPISMEKTTKGEVLPKGGEKESLLSEQIVDESKEVKNLVITQANNNLKELISAIQQDEQLSTEESSTEESTEEIDISSLSFFSSLLSNVENNKQQEEIEQRLEKNRNFARMQQEKEESKGFCFKMKTCPPKYYGRPVLVNKEGEMNYRQVPKMEGTTDKTEIKYPRVGIASCQGKRVQMEDATDVAQIFFSVKGEIHQAYTFAVFDGHGGSQAATYAKENFAKYLQKALERYNKDGLTSVGIWNALKVCFKILDENYEGFDDGTTATVAIILEDKIQIANVGDSRIILVKDGKATQATEDAKPNIARYKNKIEKIGGSVEFVAGVYRVNGSLAIARAIGDKLIEGNDGERCISPNPKITEYSLKDFEGGYIVAACDGLYDVATTNEVGQAIADMTSQNLSTDQMSQQLVCGALDYGSLDNVSVIVVGL